MPKFKTKKSIAKRIKVTRTGKVIKRKCGQDHFNMREKSKLTRNKRRDEQVSKSNQKNIKRYLPYF